MKPHSVLLFIASVMALLGALCFVLPDRVTWNDHTLRWPTMAEVMGNDQPTDSLSLPIDTIATDSISLAQTDSVAPAPPTTPSPAVSTPAGTYPTDENYAPMAAFYQSLAQAGSRKVRVIHYGDSQIEEDRMTAQIREVLQDTFGGAGVGLMPLAQTIPSRSVKQVLIKDNQIVTARQAVHRNIVYGHKRFQREDGRYGVMGQVATMNDSLVAGSEDITTICTPLTQRPRHSQVRVFADTTIHYDIHGDTIHLSGRGAVYGLSHESPTGVIVDNIPMRGCLGLVFTKMDSAQLSQFYAKENVTLIIMQFGGNAIPFNEKPSTIQSIVRGLRNQVRYVKQCAPHASILFIGPSDMLTTIDGVEQSYPMVSYMDAQLKKMAKDEHIAYFSLFRWMGGNGSMARWKEIGLAGSDGIHFMRSGARKAGNAVAEWILEGRERSLEDR